MNTRNFFVMNPVATENVGINMTKPEGSHRGCIVLSQIDTLHWTVKRTGTQRRTEVSP